MINQRKKTIRNYLLFSLLTSLLITPLVSIPFISDDVPFNGAIDCGLTDTGEIAVLGKPAYTPSDQYYASNQYVSMNHLGDIEEVWDYYQGEGLTVAIIDSGIDYLHPDFYDENGNSKIRMSEARWYAHITSDDGHGTYTTCSGDTASGTLKYFPVDNGTRNIDGITYVGQEIMQHSLTGKYSAHGTNVAGTVGAFNHDSTYVGTIGIAPKAKILPIKVDFYTDSIGSALYYINELNSDSDTTNDVHVVNISIESGSSHTWISTYASALVNKGTIIVAAAGNHSTSTPTYPAAESSIIGIGALEDNSSTQLASYSNFNATSATQYTSTNNTEIVAPGQVYAPNYTGSHTYTQTHGTSFASPIVAGAALLWKQAHPSGTVADFRSDLHDSSVDIGTSGWDYKFGYGRLDVDSLLEGPKEIVINNPEIVNNELALDAGQHLDLDLTVRGIGSFSQSVTYELTENNGTISIDSNGRITALNEGEELITITSSSNPDVTNYVYVSVTGSIPVKVLSSISLSGQTTQYWVNDTFSFDGICTAHYSDGTSAQVTPTSVTSPNMSTAGDKTITVSYTEDNITQQASYTISVQSWILSSIEITTPASQLAFNIGSTFNYSGLVVTAYYTNNKTKEITPTVTAPDLTSEGEKTVNISYTEGGVTKTTSYVITVTSKTTTGTLSFENNVTQATSSIDDSIWTANNCTAGNYLAMKKANSTITSSVMLVNPNIDVDIDIHVGYYGGKNSSISVYGKNSSNEIVTNTITITPTSNGDKSYTGTLSFTKTNDDQITFYIVANPLEVDSKYIRFYSLKFDYKAMPKVTSLSLDKSEIAFDLYGTKSNTITPTLTYETGAVTTVTYTLSANGIVSLSKYSGEKDETITVTALSVGSVIITAKAGSKTATCSVSVVDTTPVPVSSLTLSNSELSLVHSQEVSLTATILPNNATNKTLTWTTSNSSIVSITENSNISVTLTAEGTTGQSATITVSTTDGSNISKTCEVTIIDKVVLSSLEFVDLPETVPFASTFALGSTKVKANYTDGTSKIVTSSASIDTSGINTKVLGNNPITASYSEDNIDKQVTDYVFVTNEGASSNVGNSSSTTVAKTNSYTFTTASWGDLTNSFTSGKAGNQVNSQGVQIAKGQTGANATSKNSFNQVSKVIVTYSTNASSGAGSIAIQIGSNTSTSKSVTNSGGIADRTLQYDYNTKQTGIVKFTITCSSNSIYIKSIAITYDETTEVTYPASPSEQAIAWSTYFLNELQPLCAANGNTSQENLTQIESLWTTFANEYGWMTSDSKSEFVHNNGNNAQVAKAQRIYEMIVLKYHFANFVTDGSNNSLVITSNNILSNNIDKNIFTIIISLISSITVIGIYYIYRRRKAE